jgi:16S rRNA (guanine966-N2)-methyltransferase
VVERSSRSPEPAWPSGFTEIRHKRYGETVLWYGHAASTPLPAQE